MTRATPENTRANSTISLEDVPNPKRSELGGNFDLASFLTKHNRIPSLDGWRALSICIVIGSHVPHMSNFAASDGSLDSITMLGEFGVDIFFVLSGFLITYLLLLEQQKHGNISLRDFYFRRVLRILPIYLAFLAVFSVISHLSDLQLSGGQWIRVLTFTANYPSTDGMPFSVGHLWSLSVEEQFYLIWPALLLITLRGRKPIFWTLLGIAVFIAVPPIARVAGYLDLGGGLLGYHAFLTRCDSIAWGGFFAALCVFRGTWVDRQLTKFSRPLLASALLTIGMVLYCFQNYVLGPIIVPFGRTLLGVSVATVILISVRYPRHTIFAWLNWRPVAFVGVLSYSLYIWQQLFVTNASSYGLKIVPWFLTPELFLLPLFGIAYASNLIIERPFLRMKNQLFKKSNHESLISTHSKPKAT